MPSCFLPSVSYPLAESLSVNLLPESQAMHLKLPTVDSDYVIDCASISSYFSDTSDFTDGLVDSPIIDGDFSEYMWMENVDEFDKEVMQQLEEEALMEECIEAMLDEVDDEEQRNLLDECIEAVLDDDQRNLESCDNSLSDVENPEPLGRTTELCHLISLLCMDEKANVSTLNPDAAEFIPQQPKISKYDTSL